MLIAQKKCHRRQLHLLFKATQEVFDGFGGDGAITYLAVSSRHFVFTITKVNND
jgi:hypothetical protein